MGKEQNLTNAVVELACQSDGKRKLACAQAFKLAGEFGVAVIEIGRVCNHNDIKICKCQLGCFG